MDPESNLRLCSQKIEKATPVMMDRWQIAVSESDDSANEAPGDPMPYNIVNNYFSIGVVRGLQNPTQTAELIPLNPLRIPGCCNLLQISHRAREESTQVQLENEEQNVVL
jgi:hypothetical protein